MRSFVLVCMLLGITTIVIAQPNNMVFSVQQNVPYIPLESQNVVTTLDWDDFDADIPLGFTFSCLNDTTSTLYIRAADENYGADLQMKSTLTNPTFNLIGWFTDLADRHNIDSTQFSTIGYKTNVVNGKKITKVEYHNVGIFDGVDPSDSVNLQTWFYESGNALEFRFGPSSRANITSLMKDPTFYGFKGPIFYMISNFDPTTYNFDWMYSVADETLQQVDSIDGAGFLTNPSNTGVDSFPKTNTLYRWEPAVNAGFNSVYLSKHIQVFPTLVQSFITVAVTNQEPYWIQLRDAQGRLRLQTNMHQSSEKIDMSALAAGTYYISVGNSDSRYTYPVIKQ